MKTLLTLTTIAICVIPVIALASNDVTLTTDTVISVGGYTLNVSGSSAVVDSITVNPTNFSVNLSSGSSLTVSSPTLNKLSADTSSGVTTTCTGSVSSLAMTYVGVSTVTIAPSSDLCSGSGATPTPTPSSSSSSGSYSGGSGGYMPSTANTTTPTVPGCPANMTCTAIPGFTPSPITDNQTPVTTYQFTHDLTIGSQGADVTALQELLMSQSYLAPGYNTGHFGSLTQAAVAKFQSAHGISPASGRFGPITRATIAGLANANAGSPTPSPASTAPAVAPSATSFTRDLTIGSTGDDVKALQVYLNTHGFTIATSGVGSSGNESTYFGSLTKEALSKFQKAHGIAATGYCGPITGAYISAHQ